MFLPVNKRHKGILKDISRIIESAIGKIDKEFKVNGKKGFTIAFLSNGLLCKNKLGLKIETILLR